MAKQGADPGVRLLAPLMMPAHLPEWTAEDIAHTAAGFRYSASRIKRTTIAGVELKVSLERTAELWELLAAGKQLQEGER